MTFLASLPPDGPARDRFLLDAIGNGKLDPPTWVRVPVGAGVEVEVSADYLTIGGERVPMAAHVAQAAVDSLDALLPTPAIVDAIERAALLVPMPTWTPGVGETREAQTSGSVFDWADRQTRARLAEQRVPRGRLIAGHRKDVVLADAMPAGCVVIYGGRWEATGKRVQLVYAGHGDYYEDYSHGVRAVRRAAWLDGAPWKLDELLMRGFAGGPVARLRYPATSASAIPRAPLPPPIGPRLLQVGARGEDVAEVQRLVTRAGWYVRADGIFGPLTKVAIQAFQRARGLDADGIVGPKTWVALRDVPAIDDEETPVDVPAAIPFVQARNFYEGRERPIGRIVLHTAEIAEVPTAAENLAAWAAGPNAPMASWHFAVDADSVVQCVREEDTAFAAPGCNADGIQIEMSGRAGQGVDGWADMYSRAVVARTARLVADLCRRHGLPIAFVDAAGLVRGEKGITTHAEVTKAYRRSTHTDPGKDFDMVAFLGLVQAA